LLFLLVVVVVVVLFVAVAARPVCRVVLVSLRLLVLLFLRLLDCPRWAHRVLFWRRLLWYRRRRCVQLLCCALDY